MKLILNVIIVVLSMVGGVAGAESLNIWLVGREMESDLFVVIQDSRRVLLYSVDSKNVQESGSATVAEGVRVPLHDLKIKGNVHRDEGMRNILLAIGVGDYSKVNSMQAEMILNFIGGGGFQDVKGGFEKLRGSIVERIKNSAKR